MDNKRILTIQDISCVGQCSTTVALPVISACGVECAILPSSVLSTHTAGKFREVGYTVRDLSSDFAAIEEKWKLAGIKFDAVYTGYLGSPEMIDMVLSIMDSCLKEGGLRIVDPAMADSGVLYPAFDMAYVEAMKKLCASADYVLPNITEASLLTGIGYKEKYDEAYVRSLSEALHALGAETVVITGVGYDDKTTGVCVFENGKLDYYRHMKVAVSYHGTGDIYSSAFTACLMRGKDPFVSAQLAANFTCRSILDTVGDDEHWYGVKFEPLLGELALTLR